MSHKTSTVLKSGRAYFRNDPKHWTQKTLYRARNGMAINNTMAAAEGKHRGAASACTMGGLWIGVPLELLQQDLRKGAMQLVDKAAEYIKRAIPEVTPDWIVSNDHGVEAWNDAYGRTFAQVMAVFNRAIALAEADEEAESWQLPTVELTEPTPCQVEEAIAEVTELFNADRELVTV